jgi:hypothetical protein
MQAPELFYPPAGLGVKRLLLGSLVPPVSIASTEKARAISYDQLQKRFEVLTLDLLLSVCWASALRRLCLRRSANSSSLIAEAGEEGASRLRAFIRCGLRCSLIAPAESELTISSQSE